MDEGTRDFRRLDYAFLAGGALLSFFLASVLMTGWPEGLIPNFKYPYIYAGDGLFQFWLSQRAIEGWIFDNPRNGFPFGSSFLDFPGSDSGNLLALKILGKISGSYFAATNLHLLLSFSAAFATAFYVFRKINLHRGPAFAGALLFSFLPYHFARILMGHLFYTWYFVVPIYFYVGFKIFELKSSKVRYFSLLGSGILLTIASCFGVYFAFFGVIVILVCGIAGFFREKNYHVLLASLSLCIFICAGVVANIAPNIANSLKNGKNIEVAQRSPIESEVYALKMVHLFLPYQQHRIKAFREFTQNYNKTFPLSNTVSSIGAIGIIGLLSMIFVLFRVTADQQIDQRLRILTLLTIMLLLTATVGGLNVLFASFISPMIRGWDRISVFIAFFSIAAFFVMLDKAFANKNPKNYVTIAALISLTTIGILDQTAKPSYNSGLTSKATFFRDRKFISAIENSLPQGAAIYQIPYIPFPEAGNLAKLGGYDLLVGFLNSKNLRWSSGGMQGREADLFYRALSKSSLEEQIATAKRLGFSGIYIDKRGYTDDGLAVVEDVSRLLGRPPAITRDDGAVTFLTFK